MMERLFLLTALILVAIGCTKEAPSPQFGENSQDSKRFFKARIDGQDKEIAFKENAYNLIFFTDKLIDDQRELVIRSFGAALEQNVNDTQGASVEVSWERPIIHIRQNAFTWEEYFGREVEKFHSIFRTGIYPYLSNDSSSAMPAAEIIWRDAENKVWSSAKGEQPSSSLFGIHTSEATLSDLGHHQREVAGSVSCLLYDDDGNSILLRDGTFHLRFRLVF